MGPVPVLPALSVVERVARACWPVPLPAGLPGSMGPTCTFLLPWGASVLFSGLLLSPVTQENSVGRRQG